VDPRQLGVPGAAVPIIVAGASGAFCHLGHIGANKPGGHLIAHSGSAPTGWSINKTQVPSDLSTHLHAVINALRSDSHHAHVYALTKNDLSARVWPGAIVEDNTLQFHISAIRKAFGRNREMLKTASGRGYRLLGARQHRRRVGTSAHRVRPRP
jgi:Transcriptional regulatory protein, C terminal